MKVHFVTIKSSKNSWAESAAREYAEKINHFIPFQWVSLKSKSFSRENADQKRDWEAHVLLDYIQSSDFVMIFSEDGRSFKDSVAFSKGLINVLESGKSRIVMVIGGPYGVSSAVKDRADLSVSLSGLTMNHFVAQLVALEQIYRALAIWKNRSYHNP